jgi:hypothetical protein
MEISIKNICIYDAIKQWMSYTILSTVYQKSSPTNRSLRYLKSFVLGFFKSTESRLHLSINTITMNLKGERTPRVFQ